jgi:hypothetical protein
MMDDNKQIATMLDEQIETTVATDGTVTVKLLSDEQMIREIEIAQTMIEFADFQSLWRRYSDCKAKDRSIAAEDKLRKLFMERWDDREQASKAYSRFRLLLLYMCRVEPQA